MFKLLRTARLIDKLYHAPKFSCKDIYSQTFQHNYNVDHGESMPIVKVKQGLLRGCYSKYGDWNYAAFKGIPYAFPPVGHLRFKAPGPPSLWNGVRDATKHGPVCPQFNERQNRIEEGSEDCLYLNVYSKSLTPAAPLPVMVWIHGGGFYTGSGNSDFYGPDFFMVHDLVLVTFNYRLEVFGFLCLDNEEVPGNAGLKDQVAALRWVKENIRSFGGDPDNITIFGCSAGAACVSYHLISEMSKGLFNKAICQSGVCLNEWSYSLYPKQRAFQLAEILGKKTENEQELLNFLRSVPSSKLINQSLPTLKSECLDISDSITFAPVVEKCRTDNETFLSESPIDLVTKGEIAKVPLMLGYTSGEGIEVARNMSKFLDFINSSGAVIPREIKLLMSPEEIAKADSLIRSFYFNGKSITEDSLQECAKFETYRMFAYNIMRFALRHVQNTQSPVFVYKFAAETERNYTKKYYKMDDVDGVCHADDLYYLFNVTSLDVPLTYDSLGLVQEIVHLWYNFAATGNPTHSSFKEKWIPFNKDTKPMLIIGNRLKVVENEDEHHLKFWDDIYRDIYKSNNSEKLKVDLA